MGAPASHKLVLILMSGSEHSVAGAKCPALAQNSRGVRRKLAESGLAASKLFTAKSGHSPYCNLAGR